MGLPPFIVVFGSAICAVVASWIYFRRYRLSRPPIGVANIRDVAIMIVAIVALPFVYLVLPVWVVAAFLLLSALSVLYFTIQPMLRARWAVWLVAFFLLLADTAAVYLFSERHNSIFALNNLIVIVLVVGIANLWAQSGVKARDMVILGVALTIYDYFATALSPLMIILLDHLSNLPLAPIIAWSSEGETLILGLGDLLLAGVFPLVMRKAFGMVAGLVALTLALVAILVLLAFPLRQGFPVIIVLGPLMVAQFLSWRWIRGQERTMKQYLLEEPCPCRRLSRHARLLPPPRNWMAP
jgi:hypothetical protein